jgi:hypothetical protein
VNSKRLSSVDNNSRPESPIILYHVELYGREVEIQKNSWVSKRTESVRASMLDVSVPRAMGTSRPAVALGPHPGSRKEGLSSLLLS